MTDWYLITADSHALKPTIKQEDETIISLIEFSLRKLGHLVYYPREKIAITRMNRRIKVDRALLDQYVFVGIQPGACFYRILRAAGVYQILEDVDGNLAQVSEDQVDRFRRNEHYGMYDKTKRNKGHGLLKEGSRVRVLDGLYEGYTGIVRRSAGIETARVFLADKFVVHVPIDSLADA